jgi:general secretion pathway protein I
VSTAAPVARRDAGFTLLEVLVALAIVAVALGAGLRAAGALTDNARRLGEVTAAQWCAENELANLRLARAFPGIGDAEFRCEQLGAAYLGVLQTRPTPNPNFRRVDARISAEDGRPLVTLTTILWRQ